MKTIIRFRFESKLDENKCDSCNFKIEEFRGKARNDETKTRRLIGIGFLDLEYFKIIISNNTKIIVNIISPFVLAED